MGSSSKTCFISNTAIENNDTVILITPNLPMDNSFAWFRTRLFTRLYDLQSDTRTQIIEQIEAELLKKDAQLLSYYCPIKEVFIGEFTDDHFIYVENDQKEYKNHSHLCHKWAAEVILGRQINNIHNDFEFACELYQMAYFIRKSPFDTFVLGSQFQEKKEVQLQIELCQATLEVLYPRLTQLELQEAEYNSYEDEP